MDSLDEFYLKADDLEILKKFILATQQNKKFNKIVVLYNADKTVLLNAVSTIKACLKTDSVTTINGSDVVALGDLIDNTTQLVLYDGVSNIKITDIMKELFNSKLITTRKLFEQPVVVKLDKTNHLLFINKLEILDEDLKSQCILITL